MSKQRQRIERLEATAGANAPRILIVLDNSPLPNHVQPSDIILRWTEEQLRELEEIEARVLAKQGGRGHE